jgi:hypothetical protein
MKYFKNHIWEGSLKKSIITLNIIERFKKKPLKSQRVCTLSQKNANISILDPRPVLEASLNSTKSFKTRE